MAAAHVATTFEKWLKRAEVAYEKAKDVSENIPEKLSLMKSARHMFGKAVQESTEDFDTLRGTESAGKVSWAIASVIEQQEDSSDDIFVEYRFAIKYLSKAMILIRRLHFTGTDADIEEVYEGCLDDAVAHAKQEKTEKFIVTVESFINAMEDDHFKAKCFLNLVETLFNCSVSLLEKGDMKSALNYLHECQRPIEEIKLTWMNVEEPLEREQLSDLERGIRFHTYSAEAQQAIVLGDRVLDKALKASEDINMDMVFEAVDCYGKAVFLTKELEMVIEARALSRLGKVFDKILKNKEKAREYFNRALQLANCVEPRTFTQDEWYTTCLETIKRYQLNDQAKEEAEQGKERRQIMNEIKVEMSTLKQLERDYKGCRLELICALHQKFTPKNTDKTFPTFTAMLLMDDDEKADCVKQALRNFHPNKNHKDEYGEKWTVLCDEITKVLVKHFKSLELTDKELNHVLESNDAEQTGDEENVVEANEVEANDEANDVEAII